MASKFFCYHRRLKFRTLIGLDLPQFHLKLAIVVRTWSAIETLKVTKQFCPRLMGKRLTHLFTRWITWILSVYLNKLECRSIVICVNGWIIASWRVSGKSFVNFIIFCWRQNFRSRCGAFVDSQSWVRCAVVHRCVCRPNWRLWHCFTTITGNCSIGESMKCEISFG